MQNAKCKIVLLLQMLSHYSTKHKKSQELFEKFLTFWLCVYLNLIKRNAFGKLCVLISLIVRDFLDNADGGDHIQALAVKVGREMSHAYFVSPAFNGSSVARDKVGVLMQFCFTTKTDDVDAMIDKAFADAVTECKNAQ